MGHQRLNLDKSGLERGTRGKPDFPVSGGFGPADIAAYEGGRFECHFHPETELTLVEAGEMYYQANDRVYLLRAGDAVFVNVNVMHAGWQKDGGSCLYSPINFSTAMVYGHEHSRIEQHYVRPLVEENRLPQLVMRYDEPEDAALLASVHRLYDLRRGKKEGYELLLKAELCVFWHLLYGVAKRTEAVYAERGADAIKQAISYMEEHFAEKLSLQELSATCGLSRSEFCRVFHRFTGRTPFTYLQHLRVRRSLPLLQDKNLSVTEIAERTGFSGGSYYAEIFRRYVGVSPLGYRKTLLQENYKEVYK